MTLNAFLKIFLVFQLSRHIPEKNCFDLFFRKNNLTQTELRCINDAKHKICVSFNFNFNFKLKWKRIFLLWSQRGFDAHWLADSLIAGGQRGRTPTKCARKESWTANERSKRRWKLYIFPVKSIGIRIHYFAVWHLLELGQQLKHK